MIKCIAYDEENKRRVLKLNLDSEEEVLSYASYNKLKIVDMGIGNQLIDILKPFL